MDHIKFRCKHCGDVIENLNLPTSCRCKAITVGGGEQWWFILPSADWQEHMDVVGTSLNGYITFDVTPYLAVQAITEAEALLKKGGS